MFVVALDEKKGLAPTPIIWIKRTDTETGYYWPLYGLHFKLKNYVPLPVDPQELKSECRFVPCTILLNGERFKTNLDAKKAILKILKEESGSKKEKKTDLKKMRENEALEGGNILLATKKNEVEVECDNSKFDEVQTDEVESDYEVPGEANQLEPDEMIENQVEPHEVIANQLERDEVIENQVKPSEVVTNQLEPDEVKVAEVESYEGEDGIRTEQLESDEDDESFENFPLEDVPKFIVNEAFLKSKNGSKQLGVFYGRINENKERMYFNECVKKPFSDSFFLAKITFKKDAKRENGKDWVGMFEATRLYKCMKNAVVKKFKYGDLDDTELKQIFITNFERIRRAIKARTLTGN